MATMQEALLRGGVGGTSQMGAPSVGSVASPGVGVSVGPVSVGTPATGPGGVGPSFGPSFMGFSMSNPTAIGTPGFNPNAVSSWSTPAAFAQSPSVQMANQLAANEQAAMNDPNNAMNDPSGMGSEAAAAAAAANSAPAGSTQAGAAPGAMSGEEGAPGPAHSDGGGGGGGSKIICAELYRQGLLDSLTYTADEAYGDILSVTDPDVVIGYHAWAETVVDWMEKSPLITKITKFIATPWIKEMSFRMGARKRGSFVGKAMIAVGYPLCRFIAKGRKHGLASV